LFLQNVIDITIKDVLDHCFLFKNYVNFTHYKKKVDLNRDWNKFSILVVDDDITSVILFEEFLSSTKALIFTASCSEEALNTLKKSQIDLILMDLQLQGMSGFILLSIIRELYPNIPVIAETAYASADDRRKCIASGFNSFLSKPISFELLVHEMDKYLQ